MNEALRRPSVFIVDDEESVRNSLRFLLESIRLPVETFDSAEAFLSSYEAVRPGCLVLDVRMPGLGGPELMDLLKERGLRIPILFLSAHGDVPLAVRAMKAGAVDFLQKPYNNQIFLERVRQALRIDEDARREGQRDDVVASKLAALSPRERLVLARVIAGDTNKVIARVLGISHKTVETHRGRLMHKMGADSFASLMHLVLGRTDQVIGQ